ncbi:hypothetical protein GCM10027055_12890 [Janibacter alkaliphilus]
MATASTATAPSTASTTAASRKPAQPPPGRTPAASSSAEATTTPSSEKSRCRAGPLRGTPPRSTLQQAITRQPQARHTSTAPRTSEGRCQLATRVAPPVTVTAAVPSSETVARTACGVTSSAAMTSEVTTVAWPLGKLGTTR